MGCKVPRDMDGRVLTGLFEEEFLRAHPVEYTDVLADEPLEASEMSKEDEADVLGRLRGLGYID
jgi:hypothetical protein